MVPCKVCSVPTVRQQVDRLILEGLPDYRIARSLGTVGISISAGAITRHRKNHPPSEPVDHVELDPKMTVDRPEKPEPAPPISPDVERVLAETREQIDSAMSDASRDRVVRDTLLARIVEMHLAIATAALERFQNGGGQYPIDLIKGLATVVKLLPTDRREYVELPIPDDIPPSEQAPWVWNAVREGRLSTDAASSLITILKGVVEVSEGVELYSLIQEWKDGQKGDRRF